MNTTFMNTKRTLEELGRMSVEEFKTAEKTPVVLILDDIRSALNVGSIFRTADAFRISSLYLCGITSTPPNRDIQKSALGATESVNWEYHEKAADAIRNLTSKGFRIIGVEQCHGSIELSAFKATPGEKLAFVVGNEVKGVDQEILTQCDSVLEIAQYGTKHSMNVAVTAGILLHSVYQWYRE